MKSKIVWLAVIRSKRIYAFQDKQAAVDYILTQRGFCSLYGIDEDEWDKMSAEELLQEDRQVRDTFEG